MSLALNEKSKLIDFTDVNLYPKKYWCNTKNGKMIFNIRSFVIENIENQLSVLLTKRTKLMLGDYINVDTKFGHNIAKKNEPENWIDVPVKDVFQVVGIASTKAGNEIILEVKT